MKLIRIANLEEDSVEHDTQDSLESFTKKWEEKGLSVNIYETRGYWSLSEIVVPKIQRNQGTGTEFMNELIGLADKLGKTIILTPDTSFGGSSVNRLKKFYKRFGFVENKGKNKDFMFTDSMYRNPM